MSPATLLPVLLFPSLAMCTTWTVGPGQAHTLPSQVSTLVNDGDTVNIEAGVYAGDVARWQANDLLLRGVGGLAHLESNGLSWGDKAIWVVQGDRTTIEWIEFSECTSTSNNGAGIRQEGLGLTVRHCWFHHNENGILCGGLHPSTIRIEHCEFGYNGHGDGFSHNLYIGAVDSLIFRFNYSHHALVGHELKSRAWVNIIEYNRFSNEADGTASREVDLPDGGRAILIGNIIQQGPLGQNSNLVGFGMESLNNPGPQRLYVINNTLMNEKLVGSFFQMPTSVLLKAYNNVLAGGGSFLSVWPFAPDTAGNIAGPIADLHFVDAPAYDLHLLASSPALSIGMPAGTTINGYPLVALWEYVHPLANVERCQQATLDAGAYENCSMGLADAPPASAILHPVPAGEAVTVSGAPNGPAQVQLIDASGRVLMDRPVVFDGPWRLNIDALATGPYHLRIAGTRGTAVLRLIKD
ncbi:MAG TPA: hypothetical protein PKE21_04760 [Flavobacteriales bacterium]|nr:hypothetical protein [Flavobacteriales bacterium]HMR26770.1 hypothetical protein [Flavobacteriales bacterium]